MFPRVHKIVSFGFDRIENRSATALFKIPGLRKTNIVNPFDELKKLTSAFAEFEQLFQEVSHVPGALTPEPYKRMLVHDHHMTVTMESYHGASVDVEVMQHNFDEANNVYSRMILLRNSESGEVVQFGVVRFDFQYVTTQVRDEIVAGEIPLGRVLINHNVLRHIDLGAIVSLKSGPLIASTFGIPVGTSTYGRLATIFCNRSPAVDLLEISRPLSTN